MWAAQVATGFLSSAALIVAIGAQNAFVLRQGLERSHVLPVVLVCALADAVLIAAGVAGLGALVRDAPEAMRAVSLGGAVFLLWHAAAAARRAFGASSLRPGAAAPTLAAALANCLAFTFLNPHVYLDTVILLGAMANHAGPAGRWPFGLGAMAASGVWFAALGYGARLLVPVFERPLAWRVLDALIAMVMAGLALDLLAGA